MKARNKFLPSEAQGRCPQGGGAAAFSGGTPSPQQRRSLRSRPSGAVAPTPLRFAGEEFTTRLCPQTSGGRA